MRSIFLLGLAVLCLSGCATLHTAGSLTAYDGVSSDYPGDAQALAISTAEEMAHRYPPGRTTLALAKSDSTFGQDLESALRERGFSIAAPDAAGIQVAYTLDVIRDETPPACYLRVRTSDHTAFGTLRVLTGAPRKTREEVPAGTPLSTAQAAPASHPLNDPPSEVKPVTQPAPAHESNQTLAPAQGAASSPHAQLPSPRPVLPAKLERHEGSDQGHDVGIPVRSPATAARIAKRNHLSVEDFCRLNNVAPDTVLSRGKRVLLHPSTVARGETPAAAHEQSLRHTKDTAAVSPLPLPSSASKQSPVEVVAKSTTNPPANIPGSRPTSSMVRASVAASGPAPVTPPTVAPEKKPQAAQVSPVGNTATPPLIPPAPTPPWNIAPGSLHTQLENWAMRAHYQLIWKAHHDFELEAKAGFDGDFVSAIKQLFAGLHRGGHALRVTVYTVNNVIEIAED